MDQRVISTVGLGIMMMIAPITLGHLPSFSFPVMAQASMIFFSFFVVIGGILEASADKFKLLMDIYVLIGLILFFLGPPSSFQVGESFWITITFTLGVFMGLPVVLLLNISRNS